MHQTFLSVWLIYWAAIALLPVKSIYTATFQAFLLQLVFVFLVLAAYGVIGIIIKSRKIPEAGTFNISRALILIKIALSLSLIGFIFLIYDKIYIQGIDYSGGIAIAREQWRQVGEDRAGQASSIFSILGYLFGSGYYVAAVLAITQISILSTTQRVSILLVCFLIVMANSLITGGRSNVLLLGVFIIGAMASRRKLHLRKLLGGWMQRWIILFATGLSAGYTIYVFYQRADASELNGLEYVLDFLPFLGLESTEWFKDLLDDGMLSSLSAMLVLAASYITHSFATTAAIIDGPTEDKTIIFVHAVNILSKLGLANHSSDEWFLSGRFPSVPGALWHQFGGIGLVMGGLLLGAASAIAKAWTALRPARLLPLGVFVMLDVILILTPLLFAGDFLSFPFLLFSFLLISVVDYFLRVGKSINLISKNTFRKIYSDSIIRKNMH